MAASHKKEALVHRVTDKRTLCFWGQGSGFFADHGLFSFIERHCSAPMFKSTFRLSKYAAHMIWRKGFAHRMPTMRSYVVEGER